MQRSSAVLYNTFFYKKMRFLSYIIFYQGIWIEKKQIKAIHNLFKSQLVYNIQIFEDLPISTNNLSKDLVGLLPYLLLC